MSSIVDTNIQDIMHDSKGDETIKCINDELLVMEDLRQIPDLSARKIGFNAVAGCAAGRMTLDVAGESITVKKNQIFICHSHVIMSDFMISPDFECKVLCVSDRLLNRILQSQMRIWNSEVYRNHFVVLDFEMSRFTLYDELRFHWLSDDNPLKNEIIESLLRAVLLSICSCFIKSESFKSDNVDENGATRMETIFHQFLHNIAVRKVKKISVAEYAAELCITPKYLSTVCRTVSDKPPSKWINEYVAEDIAHYLKTTDLSAKEISMELGFPNASFFGKFVKAHLGMSPGEYKRK